MPNKPMEHIPPKFNLTGNLILTPVNPPKNPCKDPWLSSNPTKSKQSLLTARKKALLPDPSFDLDNDGYVGNLDLFLSTRFDYDKDGKLNATERLAAEKALKEGFLEKFKFGLENQQSNPTIRTVQQRGVIVENGDGEKIKETYPVMRQASMPVIVSRTQLLESRKKLLKTEKIAEKVFRIEVEQGRPEGFVTEPKFTNAAEVKEEFRNSVRKRMGMTDPTDFKHGKTPSLGYVKKPEYSSQVLMNEMKKRELLESLHRKANYEHKTREQHLIEREKFLVFHNEGKGYEELKEKQKLETNEYNQKVFSSVVMGVHGKELPKFENNLKEFCKTKRLWAEEPEIRQGALKEVEKKWAVDEKGLKPIHEVRVGKRELVKEICDKPNHVVPYGGYVPVENTEWSYRVTKVKYRPSTIFSHFYDSAREMGINLSSQTDKLKQENPKILFHDSSINPTSELLKSSQSLVKKQILKTVPVQSLLRTTGFCLKKQSEE